jgi:hypothetical protein
MKIRELISEVGAMQQIGSIAKDIGSIGSMVKKDFTAAKSNAYNTVKGQGGSSEKSAKSDYRHPLNKIVSGQLLTSSESKTVEDLILKLETGEIKTSTVAPAAAVQQLKTVMKGQQADLDTLKKLVQEV